MEREIWIHLQLWVHSKPVYTTVLEARKRLGSVGTPKLPGFLILGATVRRSTFGLLFDFLKGFPSNLALNLPSDEGVPLGKHILNLKRPTSGSRDG